MSDFVQVERLERINLDHVVRLSVEQTTSLRYWMVRFHLSTGASVARSVFGSELEAQQWIDRLLDGPPVPFDDDLRQTVAERVSP